MTLGDIKNSRPSKEMIVFRKKIEKKIEKCRSLTEFKKLEKLAKAIDNKIKH